jgi:hypothetical protein
MGDRFGSSSTRQQDYQAVHGVGVTKVYNGSNAGMTDHLVAHRTHACQASHVAHHFAGIRYEG